LNYWEYINRTNLVDHLKPFFENGTLKIRSDGNIEYNHRRNGESQWLHKKANSRFCALYHFVLFNIYGILPSFCMECWKIAVKPKTLKDLMTLHRMQKEMNVESKCGIETREFVRVPYGGYFYTESKEDGLEMYGIVRKKVDEMLSSDTDVILKRGCSEFELKFGASDKWQQTDQMKLIEKEVSKYFVWDKPVTNEPEFMIENTIKNWIKHAYKNGDDTYLEYTGGIGLYPPLVTYHKELNKEKEK